MFMFRSIFLFRSSPEDSDTAEAAVALAPLDGLENKIHETLDICGGDPMKALREPLSPTQ